jgi:hypothetical protein
VDQKELETVVPQPGGAVLVVNGLYRGAKGSLVGIDTKRFQVWRLTAYCCFTPLVSAAAAAESSHSLHCITFDASLNYLPASPAVHFPARLLKCRQR